MVSEITDHHMRAMLSQASGYNPGRAASLHRLTTTEARATIREHSRRNLLIRANNELPIVRPVIHDTDLCGVCTFGGDPATGAELMDRDSCGVAGLMTYDLHPILSFPRRLAPTPERVEPMSTVRRLP